MNDIHKGRWTARPEEPFVVFLIGMRLNKLWKVHSWLPIVMAMPRMIKELIQHPELGFLGGQTWFGRTIVFVQYWRSFEHLEAYAKARDRAHLPAWAAFNKAVGDNGDVGVYHESYRVAPGQFESLYVNMPPTLLGACAPLVEAKGGYSGARGRMETKAAAE